MKEIKELDDQDKVNAAIEIIDNVVKIHND